MPLPLIPVAVALVAASGGGATMGGTGIARSRKAKRTVEEKREALTRSEAVTVRAREECEQAFELLGTTKAQAIVNALVPFHEAFARLKHVELRTEVSTEDAPAIDEVRVTDAGKVTLSAADALQSGLLACAASAAATGATTAGVTTLAAASTGTAISTLSGAAATNATLAWLGGGSLAAGGGGIAAGTAVLSGVAAAPALLVGGVFLHHKGRESLAKAETFAADVDAATAKHREAQLVLRAATKTASDIRGLIENIVPVVSRETGWLDALTATETDWRALDDRAKARTRRLAVCAVALSDVVHTRVMDADGTLTREIATVLQHGRTIVGVGG